MLILTALAVSVFVTAAEDSVSYLDLMMEVSKYGTLEITKILERFRELMERSTMKELCALLHTAKYHSLLQEVQIAI